MNPIFNRHGRTIGWLNNGVIYDRKNCCRAFIRDHNVFTYNAQHLGAIHKGVIFDKSGRRIAYMDEASHDSMLPVPQIPPPPPIFLIPSATPIPPKPPKIIQTSLHWNPIKWELFLEG